MDDNEKALLAGYHKTISDQLNSRLSESPKFFGLLVVIGSGYGFVLSHADLGRVYLLAVAMTYVAILWAAWYLAALGYGFRFLQYSQIQIERGLFWSSKCSLGPEAGRRTGDPPLNPRFWNAFWLLPSIYHPHVAALFAFQLVIWIAYWRNGAQARFCHPFGLNGYWWFLTLTPIIAGGILIWAFNWFYLNRFLKRWTGSGKSCDRC